MNNNAIKNDQRYQIYLGFLKNIIDSDNCFYFNKENKNNIADLLFKSNLNFFPEIKNEKKHLKYDIMILEYFGIITHLGLKQYKLKN
jgi:hypothetical protein